jgi:hypothetical protein
LIKGNGFDKRELSLFTPLESPAIYGRDNINKASAPYRKGGVKAPSFLKGFIHCEMIGSEEEE